MKKIKQAERITDTHIYFWGSYLSQWAKYSFIDPETSFKFISHLTNIY